MLLRVLLGSLGGVLASVGLLGCTHVVLAWWTAPRVLAVEHNVIYQAVILGAGFGALAGSVMGLARVVRNAGNGRAP